MALFSLDFHSSRQLMKTETEKMTQLSHFEPVTLSISKLSSAKAIKAERAKKSGRGGSCKWPNVSKTLSICIRIGFPMSKTKGIRILRISRPHHTLARENRITGCLGASQPVQPVWLGFFSGCHFEETHRGEKSGICNVIILPKNQWYWWHVIVCVKCAILWFCGFTKYLPLYAELRGLW